MTTLTQKTFFATILLSTVMISIPAHAKNSFNKFPSTASVQNIHGLQDTSYSSSKTETLSNSVIRKNIRRIVEPVPTTRTLGLSYATDTGTLSLERGFNKMRLNKSSPARPMKVIVDQRAYTAR